VTVGPSFTVRAAAVVVAVLQVLVKTAWNWFPSCPAAAVKVRVVEVAPGTSLKVAPPSVLTCHWTVGAGVPLAAALKETLLPAQTVWLEGFVVTAGATFTVSVAAVVVAVPQVLVKTARYRYPSWASATVKESVVEVAPGTSLKVAPPSVLTCHWTVGAGLPLAAAVNVAVLASQTAWLEGFVVTAGAVFTVRVAAVVVAVPQELVKTARYL
jgi:hypothetical protein